MPWLGIGFTGFTVNINDRRILRGMLESMGFAADTLDSVCITFDKMDKIGAEGVKAELTESSSPEAAITRWPFRCAGDVTLESVASRCADPAIADDLKYVLATAKAMANGRFDVATAPAWCAARATTPAWCLRSPARSSAVQWLAAAATTT